MPAPVSLRGVYGCFVHGELVYVGSSSCHLNTLAYNHRHWRTKYGAQGQTHFRSWLTKTSDHRDNEFRWLIEPALRTLREVEALEGEQIRSLRPPLNIDMDPVRSSIKYGRYPE